MWDLEKFFDSVDLMKLIFRAISLGYNPVMLYLGICVHLAPRVLQGDNKVASRYIAINRSILAGC